MAADSEGTPASSIPVAVQATVAAQLASLEKDTMGASWYKALEDEFKKTYFSKVYISVPLLTHWLINMLAERFFI